MLKFLLPLIAALKVDCKSDSGWNTGANVAYAWIACRKELEKSRLKAQQESTSDDCAHVSS